jgi:hypothetical protein
MTIMFLVVLLGVGIAVNLFLRSWLRGESRREAHLRDPGTHTIAYEVPNGVDPVTFMSPLVQAGFTSGSTGLAWPSACASSARSPSGTGSAAYSRRSR